MSNTYNSVVDYKGAKYSARNTFLIDPQGNVVRVFPKMNPTTHSEQVLAARDELQKK